MKLYPAIFVALACIVGPSFVSCNANPATGERVVDVERWVTELRLASLDLEDVAAELGPDHEGTDDILAFATVASDLADAFERIDGAESTRAQVARMIDKALAQADTLLEQYGADDEIGTYIRLGRIALRRLAAYV